MQVTSTTPTASTTPSSSTANSTASTAAATANATQVDYNSFLKLLVAELQNQDPTSPADPTQYLSQLASFSAVGQQVQTNQMLTSMLTTSALSQADTTIGRTVTSADGTQSGVVKSVNIGSTGSITATLNDGSTLALGAGVTIS